MIYKEFKGIQLSNLGFGTMRLPLLASGNPDDIDFDQVARMCAYAIEHGINYFDTAHPYHGGRSELALGNGLRDFDRSSYYLADKYPGHQVMKHDPAGIFEQQLKKLNTDYIDFYLYHNVNEFSINNYMDKRYGIIEYFKRMKGEGKIRYLGFSTHGSPELMERYLDEFGDFMEFCQIQLNYLDWTLQDAERKYKLLEERGIPVWTMESIRGGRLAQLNESEEAQLRALRPNDSAASWALRWLQGKENVKVILSGMSSLDQMVDNIRTFEEIKPLNDDEIRLLAELAEGMKNNVPCTACRYCVAGCPKKLPIPELIAIYNSAKFQKTVIDAMRLQSYSADQQPDNCIACGKCARSCPQKIAIPDVMKDFAELAKSLPNWVEVCREREAMAAKSGNSSDRD